MHERRFGCRPKRCVYSFCKEQAAMKKDKIKIGIIPLVAVLFAISILVTGVSVYFSQRFSTDDSVRKQMEKLAAEVADETEMAIKEYPAYEWLIKYNKINSIISSPTFIFNPLTFI